jgi:hypothetical protein
VQVKRCVILAVLPPRQLACFDQGSWHDFTTAVGMLTQMKAKKNKNILKKVLTNVLTYVIIYSNSGILLKFS